MKLSQLGAAALLICASAFAFQNCAQTKDSAQDTTSSAPVQLRNLAQMQTDLKTLSASDLSCSADLDCELIAAGSAACGGADFHVVVSKKNPQYQAVVSLAQEYTYQDKLQTPPNVVGSCTIETNVTANCVANACVKQSTSIQ